MNIKDYIDVARPSHWIKNVFMLPGTFVAALFIKKPLSQFAPLLIIGIVATCFVASANYVINEWKDAKYDKYHPDKKKRPVVCGKIKLLGICIEYVFLLIAGFTLSILVSWEFLAVEFLFAIAGVIYNVEPFRLKEKPYLDVLLESINNPIRLTLGWLIVTSKPLPPSSLIFGFWMCGAFLMGMKRFAELKHLGSVKIATQYRRSFQYYTEKKLLISSYFYSMCSAMFLGVFLIKYRIELVLLLPFLAGLFAWYLYIAMKPNSPAQYPEQLYREKLFFIFGLFTVLLLIALMLIDIPSLRWLINNSFLEVN